MSTTPMMSEFGQRIYERSKDEALASGFSDLIEDGDGTMWLPGTRGSARAFYAGEQDVPFTKVRVRREYMRINLQAIWDAAYDLASDAERGYTVDPDEIAYTYDGEGWMWEECAKDDPRALGLWRCERLA